VVRACRATKSRVMLHETMTSSIDIGFEYVSA
jgi:hypothetical protein